MDVVEARLVKLCWPSNSSGSWLPNWLVQILWSALSINRYWLNHLYQETYWVTCPCDMISVMSLHPPLLQAFGVLVGLTLSPPTQTFLTLPFVLLSIRLCLWWLCLRVRLMDLLPIQSMQVYCRLGRVQLSIEPLTRSMGRSFYDVSIDIKWYLLTNYFLLVLRRESLFFIEDHVTIPN